MYWDGSRWIDDRVQHAERSTPRPPSYRPGLAAVVTAAFLGLVVLTVPSAQPAQAGYRSEALTAAWGTDFSMQIVQESASTVDTRGTWVRRSNERFLGGHVLTSWRRGSTMTATFTGTGIAVVGPTSRHRGRARIAIDGRVVATVTQRSARYHRKVTLYATTFPAEQTHTITVTVLGANRDTKFSVDAFMVRHAKRVGRGLPTPTPSPSADPTATPAPTTSADPTATPAPTTSADPTATPAPTTTPAPTATPAPTTTPAPTATPAPTTTPAPTAASSGIYGTAFNMDCLANMQVGGDASGSANTQVAFRFRATTTSALQSIRVYILDESYPGYGGGNGGTLEITLRPESGGTPSSTVLGSITVAHPSSVFKTFTFSPAPTVTKGQIYDIVFTNVDPNPTLNFVSLDLAYDFTALTPRQPDVADTDLGALRRFSGGGWKVEPNYTPIVDIGYTNGVHQGQGYMEVEVGHPALIGGSNTARERFTVSGGSRSVSGASVRVGRISGSGQLTVRLERSDGSLIDAFSIDASQVPQLSTSGNSAGVWLTGSFATTHDLSNGTTYNLRLVSNGSLWSRGIQQGDSYGFASRTYFADGQLQVSTNGGSSWASVSGLGSSGDLQFDLH